MGGRRFQDVSLLRKNGAMRNIIIVLALLLLTLIMLPSFKLDSRRRVIDRCNEIMAQYNINPVVDVCLRDIIKRESVR